LLSHKRYSKSILKIGLGSNGTRSHVILKLCDPPHIAILCRFLTRTDYSLVPAKRASTSRTLAGKPSMGNIQEIPKRRNSSKYHSGSIRKGDFPLVSIDPPSSFLSLILDDRKICAEPDDIMSDTSDSSSHSVQDQIIQSLDQVDWVRLALVPGKVELDLSNPQF